MAIELATAYVALVPTTTGIQAATATALSGAAVGASKAGADAGKQYGTAASGGMSSALKGAVGIAAAAGAIGLVKDAVGEARESQKVGATTAQIIKQTGGAANLSADQVGNLSTAISNKTGIDDEAIQTGANLLLTFKNVANQAGEGANVFDRATGAAADLSAAGFGSMESASTMLGKALNDPVAGISALGRAGVTFSDQQKEQIKTLTESGDVLGAQKIIMAEVESQVGGVAEASATAGEKLSTSFGNFKETIGTALLPVIDKVQSAMTGLFGFFSQNTPVLYGVLAVIGLLTAAMLVNKAMTIATTVAENAKAIAVGVSTGVAKAAAAAQWLWNAALSANPIALVVIAIAALVAGLIWFFTQTEVGKAIVEAVWGAIKTAISAVADWWTGTFVPALSAGWDAIVGFFKAGKDKVTSFLNQAWEVIKTVWSYSPIGLITSNWDAILEFFKAIPEKVGGFFSGVGDAISRPFRSAFNKVAGFWNDSVGSLSWTVPDWIPVIGGNTISMPTIPMLASGALITGPTLAMVGEGNEPEAVLPLSKLDALLAEGAGPDGGPIDYRRLAAAMSRVRLDLDGEAVNRATSRRSYGLGAI